MMEDCKTGISNLKGALFSLENVVVVPAEQSRLARHAADLKNLMNRFQEIQLNGLEKCKDFIVKAKEIVNQSQSNLSMYNGQSVDELDDSKLPLIKVDQNVIGLEQEISYNEQLIAERDQGIKEIEAAMNDVHEIFRDLGLLVSEQQLGIDNIESSIEQAGRRTREAAEELNKSNEYRRSRAWSMYSFLLFILILLIILVLVLSI